jgi:hypothetical protein
MTNPMIKIVNAETGEEIEREMNAAEFKQYEKDQADVEKEAVADAKKAADKALLLSKLGITEDEARLLLG